MDKLIENDLKVVVIGGGTGSFTILSALKKYTNYITSVVNMSDDGGSTGTLRDELGVLPPGDVRQCLVALSNSDKLRDLFNYRFNKGGLDGHSFGNLFLTALEKVTGNFEEAVKTASEILNINGEVIPVTLDDVRLKMAWDKEKMCINGEKAIDNINFKHDPRKAEISLVPNAEANPRAVQVIWLADIIIIAPGSLYTSLAPVLVIKEISEALRNTKAMLVDIVNLTTKDGQTNGFTVSDHVAEIERFTDGHFVDYALYNNKMPGNKLTDKYKQENAFMVEVDDISLNKANYKSIGDNFISATTKSTNNTSQSLIRHNADMVVKTILKLYSNDFLKK